MRSPRFENPRFSIIRGNELSLSGAALLVMMQAVLEKNKPFRFKARGHSMAPFIHDGDVVTIRSYYRSSPSTGEIVSFIHPDTNKVVIHRILHHHGRSYFIKGDGVDDCSDGWIPGENILGRIVQIERNGRTIRLGLGMERYLISWLSRLGVLFPLRNWFGSRRKIFPKNGE